MSVYYVLAPELDLMKVGFATDAKTRFNKIQCDSPVRLILVTFEAGDETTEATRHYQFRALRQRGEWFRYEGALRNHVMALPPIPAKEPSMNARVIAVGISKTYASMILSGKAKPARSLSIAIFRATGWRHESIAALTEEQITTLEAIERWSPPARDEQAAA